MRARLPWLLLALAPAAAAADWRLGGTAELATAVQHELPIILIIANNSMYGTIRMHEEREYPGRVIATELQNPDFVAWAEAFGARGERVDLAVVNVFGMTQLGH